MAKLFNLTNNQMTKNTALYSLSCTLFASSLMIGCGSDDDNTTSDSDVGLDAGSNDTGSNDSGLDQNDTDANDSGLAQNDTDQVDSTETDTSEDPQDDVIEPEYQEIEWEPCPLITGMGGQEADCGFIEVPLSYENPENGSIEIFLKRLPGYADGQIWLLMGGPGGSTVGYDMILNEYQARSGGMDVYLIEHRGVGESARLGCEEQESEDSLLGRGIDDSEFLDCVEALQAEWGDSLAEFTVTAAAMDLDLAIETTRTPEEPVFIYGASYGTIWGHRYMHLRPNGVTGLILDSICSPGECTFPVQFTVNHETIAEKLFEKCAEDETCSGYLGENPFEVAHQVLDDFENGLICPELSEEGISRLYFQYVFSSLLRGTDSRLLIPAIIHRLRRCEAGDVTAMITMFERAFAPDNSPSARLGSAMLGQVIARSELWEDPFNGDIQEYEAQMSSLLFASRTSESYETMVEMDPFYLPDEYAYTMATTDVPLLMLNGTMDPQTPDWVAEAFTEHFDGENQHYALVENAAHGIMTQSRYANDPFDTCGWDLLERFIADPTGPQDMSCDPVEEIQFEHSPSTPNWFGVSDLWMLSAEPQKEQKPLFQHPHINSIF